MPCLLHNVMVKSTDFGARLALNPALNSQCDFGKLTCLFQQRRGIVVAQGSQAHCEG